jgi:hypothetical protein
VTVSEGVAICDYCQAPQQAGAVFRPYAGVVRCRDTAACEQRQVYSGSHAEPPTRTAAPAVSGTGPCAICGASAPDRGLYERTPGVAVCIDRAGCDWRAIDTQFLTAHAEEFRTEYTSAEMRAAAMGAVAQAAAQGAADVPADVAEARQAAAQADYAYSLAAAGRRR